MPRAAAVPTASTADPPPIPNCGGASDAAAPFVRKCPEISRNAPPTAESSQLADLAAQQQLAACVIERLERIEQRIEELERERRRPTREQLVRILRVWTASRGSTPFITSEMLNDANVRLVAGRMTPSQLGAELRSIKNRSLDGYVVRVIKTEGGRRLWEVHAEVVT
jgi:hypothetical protein